MKIRSLRLLALQLTGRGCGYALMDRRHGLLDYGYLTVLAEDDNGFLERVARLLSRRPANTIVLENLFAADHRPTAQRRAGAVIQWAHERGLGLCQVSKKVVDGVVGAGSAQARADVILRRFPELAAKRPPARLPWKSQDDREHVFAAVALAMTVMWDH